MIANHPVTRFFLNPYTLLVIYILAAVFAGVQDYFVQASPFQIPAHSFNNHDIVNNAETMKAFVRHTYTNYNNFVIFKRSWFHLLASKNLYVIYPSEQWDLFKYSPTFAFLMAPFAYLPDLPGLILWNLLNVLALYVAIRMLPLQEGLKGMLLLFVFLELLNSVQNAQSNALMAALMVGAYVCMQRGKAQWATLWLVAATFIKIYGAIGFCLFLFYPGKPKFIFYSILWTALFAVMPLIVTPAHILVWQYHNWATMLAADQAASYGLSVMGWLHSWFGLDNIKTYVTIVGIVLFLLPLLRVKMYKDEAFRLLVLASMLVWVIIFNHKAESPTYIIALTGAGIWYYAGNRSTWRIVFIIIVLISTSFTISDIFPASVKDGFFVPYVIKAVPCIFLWIVMFVELMSMKKSGFIGNRGHDIRNI